MSNIFENAYFGKPYRTRDGRKAIYIRDFICNGINHLVTTGNVEFAVNGDGKVDNNLYQFGVDIISEWQEDIDKDKVYNCAKDAFKHSAFKSDDAWGEAVYCTGYHEGWCDAIKTIQRGNDT